MIMKFRSHGYLLVTLVSMLVIIAMGLTACAKPAPAPVSPQFNRIAFADKSPHGGYELDIYSMKTDGSGVVNLIRGQGGGRNDYPSWSPDGAKIVFLSSRGDYGREIYMMNTDGSNQTRLTDGYHKDYPTLSPDGTKIAYTMSWGIWVMNADGSNQTRLTDSVGGNISPSWSPYGTKIAFSGAHEGKRAIYMMNVDGTNQIRGLNSSSNI